MSFVRLMNVAGAAIALSACATSSAPSADEKPVGMANPASVHCLEKGGRLESKKNAEGGEYALCHLPDGTVVEEWELYRRDQGKN